MNSFGIFQAFYADYLELPPSQISWIGSIQTLLHFFLATVSGRISDAGYFRHIFALGTFFQILGLFTMSFCTEYWQLVLSQGVCIGIASGLLCVPSLAVASTYFDKRRSLAFGIMTCGNVTGGLVFPAMVRQMLPSVGFGWAMRAVGFIQVAILIACNLVVKPRVKPNPSGPLVELAAFKEPPYTLYAAAMFFVSNPSITHVFGKIIVGSQSCRTFQEPTSPSTTLPLLAEQPSPLPSPILTP